jgi:hypothetical protein
MSFKPFDIIAIDSVVRAVYRAVRRGGALKGRRSTSAPPSSRAGSAAPHLRTWARRQSVNRYKTNST